MKRMALLLLVVALLATAGAALTQSSGSFDLSWRVIAGGGGQAASDSYQVRGTAGQGLAGPPPLTGGNYAVESGFWVGVPLETPTPTPESSPTPTPEEEWELYLPAVTHPD